MTTGDESIKNSISIKMPVYSLSFLLYIILFSLILMKKIVLWVTLVLSSITLAWCFQSEPPVALETIESGNYADYAPEKVIQAASEGKKVVLFFHANRCPSCRVLDKKIIEQSATIPDDVLILRTDYDTQDALKSTYGVTAQHTLVALDETWKQVNTQRGWNSVKDVMKLFE